MAIIGIDIGGTHFRIGAVGEKGEISDFRKLPVTQVFTTTDPLEDLTGYLKEYCRGKQVDALSIGFPATIDAHRETVLQAPNVAFMENLPVVRVLTERLAVPVFIERDVTMALLHDSMVLNIHDGIVCGFYFGTGLGNAITIDGIPLIGKDGTAGELGHIPVDGNERACGCGNQGCMETLAAGRYLVELCRSTYPHTPVSDLFREHGSEPLLLQFVDRMAMAVATEINILNPHHILIGGGVPSMDGFPRAWLLERIYAHSRKPYPAQSLHILFTEDEDEKTVQGAGRYGFRMLKKEQS